MSCAMGTGIRVEERIVGTAICLSFDSDLCRPARHPKHIVPELLCKYLFRSSNVDNQRKEGGFHLLTLIEGSEMI